MHPAVMFVGLRGIPEDTGKRGVDFRPRLLRALPHGTEAGREFFRTRREVFGDVIEHLRPVMRRGGGPAGGLGRGLHRIADVLAAAEAHLADGLAFRSVHGIGMARIGPRLLAADIELGGAVNG